MMNSKKLGIFSAGTVLSNRLPDLVMKDEKTPKREGRGSMGHCITHVDGVKLCVTRRFDDNVINLLSTLSGCEPKDSVKRWPANEKKHIQVERPDVIKNYN